MKALIYNGPYSMTLKDIPEPEMKDGEVLIRIKAVGACGSDVHGFSGKTGRRYPGMVMGHEIAGHIEKVSSGVTGLTTGQGVVIQPIIYCGVCDMCKVNMTSVCLNKKMVGVNMDTVGGLSELISVPAKNVFPIDDSVPYPVAAMVEPFAVGEGAAYNADLKEGESVAIVGSGTIGLTVMLMAQQRKPGSIYIIDQNKRKLALAEKFGAVPINFTKTDPVKAVLEATGGKGVDCSFEAVGITQSVQTAMAVTKTGGRAVWVGNSQKIIEVDMQDVVVMVKRIIGTYSYNDENFGAAVKYIENNKNIAEIFAEEEVPMEKAEELYTQIAKGEKELLRGVVNI